MVSLAIAVDGLGVLSAGDGLAEAVFDQGAGAVRVAGLVQGVLRSLVVLEQILKQATKIKKVL